MIPIIKFLIFFICLFRFSNGAPCPSFKCGSNGSVIRFPFQLQDQDTVDCSYPGFDLSCDRRINATTLKLLNSGDFLVREIDYLTPKIQLYDPQNCLPRRLLNLNLSQSPFTAIHYQNYTFLSCPPQLVKSNYSLIDSLVECLSNSTTSILATSSMSLVASSLLSSCRIMVTLPVPVSDLSDDLYLTWKVPDCRDCEGKGGTCGIYNNTVKEIVCFYNKNQAGSKKTGDLSVFRILALSITIPAMTCTLGIALFICFAERSRQITTQNNAIAPQPTTVVSTGLDDITIESYTKLVLGESKRLPGPNDGTCPICLADYCTKDTLRCIPECSHCFHAECIDEWLRMHNSCPVCRNTPSPARMN